MKAAAANISGPVSDAVIAAVTLYPIKAVAAKISGPVSDAASDATIPVAAAAGTSEMAVVLRGENPSIAGALRCLSRQPA